MVTAAEAVAKIRDEQGPPLSTTGNLAPVKKDRMPH
jgi:hypothetical protein